MNGLEMFFRAVEILGYIGFATIVCGVVALMLWVAHRYTQARYQLPISTGHLQQYEANRQMLMEQLDAAATQYQRDHELMMVFDECSKPLVEADCECPVRDDGVHCGCWWDDNKCCGCGAE